MFRSVTILAFHIFHNQKNEIPLFFPSKQYLKFSTAKLSFYETLLVWLNIQTRKDEFMMILVSQVRGHLPLYYEFMQKVQNLFIKK